MKEKRRSPPPAALAPGLATDQEDELAGSGFNRYWLALAALMGIAGGGLTWYLSNVGPISQSPPTGIPAVREAATPLGALEDLVRRADASLSVSARPSRYTWRIGRDPLQLDIESRQAGHVYVYRLSPEGQAPVLVFPNAQDPDNRIAAGQPMRLPRASWRIEAKGPPGVDHFVVMVSAQPLGTPQLEACVKGLACSARYGAAFVHVEEMMP